MKVYDSPFVVEPSRRYTKSARALLPDISPDPLICTTVLRLRVSTLIS